MSVDLGMQSPGIKILLVLRENNEGFGGVSIEEKLCYAGVLCCVSVLFPTLTILSIGKLYVVSELI